jgi:hypothetical protein
MFSYTNHRQAALALLIECPKLQRKAAGFLGHMCVTEDITDAQRKWLVSLLTREGMPPLDDEAKDASVGVEADQ